MNQLSKYIASNNKKLILNSYEIINQNKDSFHLVIYFINIHKIEIIIRKLNSMNGWNNDIKIKLYNIDKNNNQILSLGSSDENTKIIELYSNFKIEEKPIKDLKYIPKKIIQTHKNICDNLYHYNAVMTLLEQNPSYEYFFYNDNDAREFIQEHFQEHLVVKDENQVVAVLRVYDLIVPGAIKADLFRYCYLFINGGIYIDSKISSFIQFDDLIDENDKKILVKDDAPNSIYNGIMIMEKGNEDLLKIIIKLIDNVLKNEYLNDIHEPTGNKLLYHYLSESTLKLKKEKNVIKINNEIIFNCIYPNYYQENYEDFRKYYIEKNYYYKYAIYDNDYIFMFFNYNHQDKFNIFNLKDNIFVIKRIDNSIGWGMNIKIKIYDPITKKCMIKLLDSCKENELVFNI